MWKKVIAVILGLILGYWFLDDFDPDNLKGKRVLITGASAGIGEQIAYHYAAFGAKLMITSRRENVLQEVISNCRERGAKDGEYYYVTADMANMSSTEQVIKEAVKKLGGLDILVLNHIVIMPLGEWRGTPQNLTTLEQVTDINYKAYIYLTSHALSELEKNKGSIIVVNSLAGKVAIPFVAAYSASKFALDGFFSALRQEFKMRNCDISITSCIMGFIGTENAVSQLTQFGQDYLLSVMNQARPSDAALAIIKGGATRSREIFFPYMSVRPSYLLRDWLPESIEYMIRYINTPSHYI
ncbi:hydroxysteroid 11-beta-dehydrogenase 1-like protein [Patella vulgata]|uniref:hydroxysteroid 11-beta-dehydrogenase 1-like protein n=1 Tax=Patella vulgata TaxID=6465 RepID=UPI00217F9291|nr:hydroxysteroid 11-beta-dehydrogenase 1-like protein [Patella vulgata]XP_050396364.1 hydroxysteroid 11-beta-dehydrogenase 1-like protein [Patella vulgata]XP_050396366.1 hydroxysteroid 11-beta-dehydrogenase 1-like protein [Patella vulgata]